MLNHSALQIVKKLNAHLMKSQATLTEPISENINFHKKMHCQGIHFIICKKCRSVKKYSNFCPEEEFPSVNCTSSIYIGTDIL
ncbi:MAG: hypothetical protein COV66_08095 [Nitrospinae bacterium CG11_big_fil_rev_8_21_14_0_20_45_15]|nr:MAG: hypothetical protein COV66_08095 [Nitrospinae bacterium CG11_big_fil_rev_8_21_14_0_20_45_15]